MTVSDKNTKPKKDWGTLVFLLLYPIIFENNPMDGVERTLMVTVDTRALDATPKEYLAAVREAIKTKEKLSEKYAFLLRGAFSEEVIRQYLAELERRLQEIV
jgi:imidazolonepropionase-like amidohydrolase